MTVSQLKSVQQFYVDALEKHATIRVPCAHQIDLQMILFAQHQRITDMLGKLL